MHVKFVSFLFLLRKSKIKCIPLSHNYINQLFNFSFMSVLPVCLFIFLNHISTSANASRHNSQRWAKLNLTLPALMSLISPERETAGKQKRSVEWSCVEWLFSGSLWGLGQSPQASVTPINFGLIPGASAAHPARFFQHRLYLPTHHQQTWAEI